MVVTGSSEESTRRAIELRAQHPGVLFATAGVHPHHAADLTADALPALQALAREPEVRRRRRMRLDYFRDFSPRDLQRRAFGWQLETRKAAANRIPAPAGCTRRFPRHPAGTRRKPGRRALLHRWEKERDAYLELGLHIGITGWINDERRGLHLREVVREFPPSG